MTDQLQPKINSGYAEIYRERYRNSQVGRDDRFENALIDAAIAVQEREEG